MILHVLVVASTGLQRLIDFAVLLEPFDVPLLRMRFDFAQESYGLSFVAGLTRIIFRDDRFNFDRYDEAVRPN
jgi:hypothetical protein